MNEETEWITPKKIESLEEAEKVRVLQEIVQNGNLIHGEGWLSRVNFKDVDHLREHTPLNSITFDVSTILNELTKENTLADADYLALLYEALENDTQARVKRRMSTEVIPLESLPQVPIDRESLLLEVFSYAQRRGITVPPELPEIPKEVLKFIESTNVEDAALLVFGELEGLKKSQGSMTGQEPNPEFWHLLQKIQGAKASAESL